MFTYAGVVGWLMNAVMCLVASSVGQTTENVLKLPGHVTIMGLFGVFEPAEERCGTRVHVDSVIIAEAIKWYLKNLNEANSLPINIGFEGRDTCDLQSRLSEISVDIMSRIMQRERNKTAEVIAGVIGPDYSSEAAFLSPVLSSMGEDLAVTLIGYATSVTSLADVTKYPNFIRVLPSDQIQADVMVKTMGQLGWNRIAIVFEDSIYGREGAMAFRKQAELAGICISFMEAISLQSSVLDVDKVRDHLVQGQAGISPVMGYVFWGRFVTAKWLFDSIEKSSYSDVPTALMSDSSAYKKDVFESNGTPRRKVRGTLVTAPSYNVVDEFIEHWMSLFVNGSKFREESMTNPWLNDVLVSMFQCNATSCSFPLSGVETKIGAQPVFTQYALYAAHGFALAIKHLLQKSCGTSVRVCEDFYNNFKPGHVTNVLRNMSFNISDDFNFTVSSLASLGQFRLFTDENGETKIQSSKPNYELIIYKQKSSGSKEFYFEKIGEYDGNMTIDTSKIRDYNSDGSEVLWPNIRNATCSQGVVCSECIPDDLADRILFVEGDVYIVALIPVYDASDSYGCSNMRFYNGYQITEAIRYGINNFSNGSDLFTRLKVGLVVLNSCNSPSVVQRRIVEMFDHGVTLPNSTVVHLSDKILGFIGDVGSATTISASNVLTNLNYVLMSYGSSSPALSNKENHPFFMRVVSSSSLQVDAMIQILLKLDSNYVQIIYSDGAYGQDATDVFKAKAKAARICIVNEIKVLEKSSYHLYYENLRLKPHARIVIVFLRSHVVQQFFDVITKNLDDSEFVFIGSTTWAKNELVIRNTQSKSLVGSFVLQQDVPENPQLETFVKSMKPSTSKTNPWVKSYIELKRNCSFASSFDRSHPQQCENLISAESDPLFDLDEWVGTAFLSTSALLAGAEVFLANQCGNATTAVCPEFRNNPKGLLVELGKKEFNGNRLFTESGDGNLGFKVYRIAKDPVNTSKLKYEQVGRFMEEQGTILDENLFLKEPRVVSRCPNKLACESCLPNVTTTPLSFEECSAMTSYAWILLALFIISVLTSVLFTVLYIRLRKQGKNDGDEYLNAVYMPEKQARPKSEVDPYMLPISVDDEQAWSQQSNEPSPCVFVLGTSFGSRGGMTT